MGLTLKEVKTKSDLKKFISFPYDLYKGNRYWVPPLRFDEMNTLREDINPAFDYCESNYWMVFRDNKLAGRIAGIINKKYNEKFNTKEARFGWIDFIDDIDVSTLLFRTVEKWATDKEMTSLHGPIGFTDMDSEGLLVEGFDEVSTLGNIYNYPYYLEHFEKLGYQKDIDWIEFNAKIPDKIPEKIERIADIAFQRNKLHLAPLKKTKDIKLYAKEVFYLINETYKDLYGFVELSDKQIDFYVKQYFSFVRPDFVPIILDENNKVAAFGITMPSLTKALQKINGRIFPFGFILLMMEMSRSKTLDLYLTAVRSDLQNKGVNAILINQINKVCIQKGIKSVETNRELETNEKIQAQWRLYDARQHKRRRCYFKQLSDN